MRTYSQMRKNNRGPKAEKGPENFRSNMLNLNTACVRPSVWRARRICCPYVSRAVETPPRSFGARCCRPRASKKKRSSGMEPKWESSIVSNRPNEVQGTNKLCDLIRKLCVGMAKVKKVENPSEETRALRMIARANRLKDIILDELYGLHDLGWRYFVGVRCTRGNSRKDYAAG